VAWDAFAVELFSACSICSAGLWATMTAFAATLEDPPDAVSPTTTTTARAEASATFPRPQRLMVLTTDEPHGARALLMRVAACSA